MVDFIARIGALISMAMVVLFVVSIVKYKQNNKSEGIKFLKFAGIAFAIMVVLAIPYSFLEEPTDSAQSDKVDEKINTSVDTTDKNQDEENDYKQDTDATNESQTNVQATENKSNAVEKPKTESKSTTMSEGESNAEQYPAKPGAMLYDKTE
ncbi:hypothetical protein BFZC1_06978 [Lysinibacillus fusiformis ZC1]|nr:hypothetical protein BFZC1_06978 [Lysinibacillus fusiformis ZC1]